MKNIFLIFFLSSGLFIIAQPANDNCASATSLTPGAALLCSQTTQNSSLQGGECFTNYAGATEQTVWYRFTATNDSLVLNLIKTNATNCASPHVRIWGPFAAGAGCIPGCGTEIYNQLRNGDPGSHILLTGLQTAGNNQYLIQVQDVDCGGPNDGHVNFCINLMPPAANAFPPSASALNACGTAFAGSTNGGYWNSGTGAGFNNLDGNAGTTCGGCAAGADTPFIINNASWFTFCSGVAGTWQITVNGVAGCQLAAPNQGIQASVLTGTTTAFVNQGNSQNPIPPGGSWTSPVITVNAGSCAWLMIDGFAGDACNYNVTLTNVSGGCIVLAVELVDFKGYISGNKNVLEWITAGEKNNDYFSVEKLNDENNWEILAKIEGQLHSRNNQKYSVIDDSPKQKVNYYRLKQTDVDGTFEYFKTIIIDNRNSDNVKIESIHDLLGNDYGKQIPEGSHGVFIIKYNNGSYQKLVVNQ